MTHSRIMVFFENAYRLLFWYVLFFVLVIIWCQDAYLTKNSLYCIINWVYWVFGFRLLSGMLKKCFRYWIHCHPQLTSIIGQWTMTEVSSNRPYRVGVSHLLMWGWKQMQFPKHCVLCCIWKYHIMYKHKIPVIPSVTIIRTLQSLMLLMFWCF
jgi:hypothetical protein